MPPYDGAASNLMGVLLSGAGGRFRVLRQFQLPGVGRNIIVTDLNNDTRADVVTVSTGQQFDPPWQLNIWLGNAPFECR